MRYILIIISIFLINSILFGQTIICDEENIKKMADFGWSDDEIKEVCKNAPKPKEESVTEIKPKPVKEEIKIKLEKPKKKITTKKRSQSQKVIAKKESSASKIDFQTKSIKYSNLLGVRSNTGNLISRYLNPPKLTNTRFYFFYGQIISSEENRKISYLHTLDTFKSAGKIVGIDNRLSENNLHYLSLLYSSQNLNIHQRTRYDSASNNVYYNQLYTNSSYTAEIMTLEYVQHLLNNLLVGVSYNSVRRKNKFSYDYQWYNSSDDTTYGDSGAVKYESNHDYTFNSLRVQKIYKNLRFDFSFTPEVTSKENYSGDYSGESIIGTGRTLGLNLTLQGHSNDISFGHYKENESKDSSDPENESYLFGYIYTSPNIVFNGTVDYTKSKKIPSLIEPFTVVDIGGELSFNNTYFVGYEYTNYNYGDLGESSDKYRITEQYINWLFLGISFDL